MDKDQLLNIINKYYLNGLVERVCWTIKDGILSIKFKSQNKNMAGFLNTPLLLEDNELGVFNTSQLYKLINITEGDIKLSLESRGKIVSKINIKDSKFNLTYSLADTSLIETIKSVNEPPSPAATADVNQEHINMFLKSKKALSDESELCTLELTSLDGIKVAKVTLGEGNDYSNKISFNIPCDFILGNEPMQFNSNILKEILAANKNAKNTLHIFEEGMLKLESEENNINTIYYLVKLN
jgi:hypothetical protein